MDWIVKKEWLHEYTDCVAIRQLQWQWLPPQELPVLDKFFTALADPIPARAVLLLLRLLLLL